MRAMASPHITRKSLWRDLCDGTGGAGLRAVITVILALVLVSMSLFGSYMLAYMFNGMGYQPGRPHDETIAGVFIFSGIIFLGALYWLWSRPMRNRGIVFASVITVGLWLAIIPIGIFIDEAVRGGDEELLLGALVTMGFAGTFSIWLFTWRHYTRGRDAIHREDGKLDIICPSCGYRMVGLQESRCPECGKVYTLDELLAQQGFEKPASLRITEPMPADESDRQAANT